ncbi:MAG: glycosyltransferase family 4 protein [Gemmatimonadales bacterium]
MILRPAGPQRILMTADTVGGVWTYAMDLAGALGAEGVEVALATMGSPASREQRSQAAAIRTLQLYESTYRLPWMEKPWDDVQLAGEWLLGLAAEVDPDIVHLNEPVYGSLNWHHPAVAVVHSCVLSWWESVRRSAPPDEWGRYHCEMTRGLGQAGQVVAPSHWMLEATRRFYGTTRGLVIPNGRDPTSLHPNQEKERLVFAAGRLWDPAKNLLLLEEVAEGLAWPVYIAGDPSHPGRDDGIATVHARLLGHLSGSDVAAWLRRAAIYAFPARYEPFGLSVLEAALSGCALVLGDLPTLRELWDGAAVFVPPDNPGELRIALQGLMEDSILRQALAMRARRRALAYTPRRMARAYLEVYAGLVSSSDGYAQEAVCAS